MRIPMDRLVQAGFGIALLILAGIGAISYQSISRLISTSHWVERSHLVIEGLDDLTTQVTDAESAARGFVVTGWDFFLDPYYAAAAQAGATLNELRMLSGDSKRKQELLGSVVAMVDQKLSYHRDVIDLRKRSGFEASAKVVSAGRGHQLMDQIRAAIDEMENSEKALLAQRLADERSSGIKSIWASVVGAFLSLSILAFVYFQLNREVGLRRGSEGKLIQSNRLYAVLSRISEAVV